VLSLSNPGTDRVKKLNRYHQFGVPHYWLVDPIEESLSVFRWTADGYLLVPLNHDAAPCQEKRP